MVIENLTVRPLNAFRGFRPAPGAEPEVSVLLDVTGFAAGRGGQEMNPNLPRWRAWLWWLIPFAALALLLGIETDWGRGIHRLPGPGTGDRAQAVAAALLPEYRVEGGLGAHTETVSRTLFNPTRRPAPALTADAARTPCRRASSCSRALQSPETGTSRS